MAALDVETSGDMTTEVYEAGSVEARKRSAALRQQGFAASVERPRGREYAAERRKYGCPVMYVQVHHPGKAPPSPPVLVRGSVGAAPAVAQHVEAIKREQALGREARAKRTEVSYTASEVGSLAATWQPTAEGDAALAKMEAELAKLNAQVAALRALRESVRDGTWVPGPEGV